MEVTLVSGLMAVLALVISAAWAGVGRSAVDLIVRGQLLQEIDMTVAALSRDLGGALANSEGRLNGKKQGRWLGWTQPTTGLLWLCFDGGANPDGEIQWGPPDNVIAYEVGSDGTLVRTDQNADTAFTVARNVQSMEITSDDTFLRIRLTFTYRTLTKTCTLIARIP